MRSIVSIAPRVFALVVAATLATGTAWADNDDHDKGGKHGRGRGDERANVRVDVRFAEPHRVIVQNYYINEIHAGHCPPGLAKKHNGCMPPGQARKWAVGRPLPREVVYYALPPPLVVQLGAPPPGYRYVRVANDVLLLALGTGMVVDAITDLGRM
jgi:Ni/Co efflux regulator RcnB